MIIQIINDLFNIDCSIWKSPLLGFFHCHITAIIYPIITQQKSKYPGMRICWIDANNSSQKIIFHLTRNTQTTRVKK
jgi:hypothetical protein